MTLGLYVARSSPLHRLPAGAKVASLAVAGVVVFLISDPRLLALVLAGAVGLLFVAQAPLRETVRQLRPVAIILLIVLVVHGTFTTWTQGLVVVMRFGVLLLTALVVSFTTPVSAMIDALERALAPLAPLGVNPAKVSLLLSMTLRFIPLIAEKAAAVREAQRVRGLERNPVALIVPLIIRTLRLAEGLAEAIEARGYDPERDRNDGRAR